MYLFGLVSFGLAALFWFAIPNSLFMTKTFFILVLISLGFWAIKLGGREFMSDAHILTPENKLAVGVGAGAALIGGASILETASFLSDDDAPLHLASITCLYVRYCYLRYGNPRKSPSINFL